MRVLIVEDDAALQLFLRKGLELEGHTVTIVSDGDEALQAFAAGAPELMVLDLNLPRRDGIDVLRSLQGHLQSTSVLVLTGRASVEDRVACLDLGADDCLIKPFSLFELLARCRAMARRRTTNIASIVRHGELQVDRVSRSVSRGSQALDLTPKEYELLDYLLQHRGRAVSRAELLSNVWKMSPDAGTNVVDVYVNYLRRKLQTQTCTADVVETVRGSGYIIRAVAHPLTTLKRPVCSVPLPDTLRLQQPFMSGAA